MSAEEKPYTIVSRVHFNKWDDDLQTTVPGWEIKALWKNPRTIIPVFVPDTADLVSGADQLIRHVGDQLAKLGVQTA